MNLKEASYASTVLPEGIMYVKDFLRRPDFVKAANPKLVSWLKTKYFDYICTPEYAKAHEGKDFYFHNTGVYFIVNSGEMRLLKEVKTFYDSITDACKEVKNTFKRKVEDLLTSICGGNIKNISSDVSDSVDFFKDSLESVLKNILNDISPYDVAKQLKLPIVIVWD